MDYAKTLKLSFRVGDLDLPERTKRYTSSRKEGEEDVQTCPCGKAKSRTHIVGNVKSITANGMCWRRRGKYTNVT